MAVEQVAALVQLARNRVSIQVGAAAERARRGLAVAAPAQEVGGKIYDPLAAQRKSSELSLWDTMVI